MITQKITYNKDTGNIIKFQEYNNNVLTTEELYNEDNMVIQRNYPRDKSMVKLFFDNEYWYVLKKTSYIKTMDEVFHVSNLVYDEYDSLHKYFSLRITKYKRANTPLNPIEENLVISLGSRIEPDSDECTQLCTPIDNNKGVQIIKELYKQEVLKRHKLYDKVLEGNEVKLNKLIYTNWEINER
jgi:hypothetical protein